MALLEQFKNRIGYKRTLYKPTEVSLVEILLLFCTFWMLTLIVLHNFFSYKHPEMSPIFKLLETHWASDLLFVASACSTLLGVVAYWFHTTSEVTVFLFTQIVFWTGLTIGCGYFDLFTPVVGFAGLFASTAYYLYKERINFIRSIKKLRED